MNLESTEQRGLELIALFKDPFKLEALCFDKQLEFIRDPSPFKTACCSRRAGKTIADAAYLIHASLQKPKLVSVYITLTRANGKRLIWPELLDINRRFNLGGKAHESELSLTFPNKSVIYVSGAKDTKEIEKFRGLPIYLCIIDECQSFPSYIQRLIDEVISKALFDYSGTLALTGTPGPVPAGYFYDVCHSNEYAHFAWTFFDNPHIQIKSGKTPQELLDRELKRKGVTITDPTIQRECFGRWATDPNALVIRYNKNINALTSIPLNIAPDNFIIGVDLGYDDADAIAVVGWNDKFPVSYLMEEVVTRKQGITELAGQVERLIAKYAPIKVVMDTGGLGKKIAEEIRRRFQLPIVAAEKARKYEFIEFLNDALRCGRFRARVDSIFAGDAMLLEWDRDPLAPTEKLSIKDNFHSDIIDAVLYAFRESLHYLSVPDTEIPAVGTQSYFDKVANELEEAAIARVRDVRNDNFGWED